MSWQTEVKSHSARPVICIEILLDSGTLYYASADLQEPTTFWEARLLRLDPIRRGIDITGRTFFAEDIRAVFHNNDPDSITGSGHFGPLLPPVNDFEDKTVNVYLKFVSDDGTVSSQQIFSGLCSPEELTPTEFTINIRHKLRERVNILQRSVTSIAFSNAPDKSIGVGQNIILGTLASTNGAVFCPIVDTTNRKLSVAQHACKSVDTVIKEIGGVRETLTLTTHYTVNKNDTDDDENTYTSITLDASKYDVEANYFADVKGLESNGDGTGTLYSNPASAFEQLLLQFTNLTASEIDSASITAAETICTNRDYDDTGYFGTCIPFTDSGERLEAKTDTWSVLLSVARGFHHNVFVTNAGKVGLASIDISTIGTINVSYAEKWGDFVPDGISAKFRPVVTINERRERYKIAHSVQAGTEKVARGYNSLSQTTLTKRETEGVNYTAQHGSVVSDILKRDMLLSSGRAVLATWTVPGLWGLQTNSDIGDYISLTHTRALGGFSNQAIQITSVSVDLMSGSTTLSGLGAGGSFYLGTVATEYYEGSASSETTTSFVATKDTYCYEESPSSNYGTEAYVKHGESEGTGGNVSWRSGFEFNISSITSTATIQSASLQLYVEAQFDPSSFQIRKLNEKTWGENSTWNAWTNNGAGSAWTDANISTLMSDDQSTGTGFRTKAFNNDGISYLQSLLTGDGLANFTFQAMNEYSQSGSESGESYRITSSEGLEERRPLLTITYK